MKNFSTDCSPTPAMGAPPEQLAGRDAFHRVPNLFVPARDIVEPGLGGLRRQRPGWISRPGLSVIFSLLAGLLSAQEDVPRLEGVVTRADGQPAANALVSVFSAAPREGGRATNSAHHYAECGKWTRADAQGRFVLQPVNKDLIYRLLASAPGQRPDYIKDADPQFGGANLTLKALRLKAASLTQRASAKLIDPAGRPVAGARIEVGATRRGGSTTYSSTLTTVDPMAQSDERGEFFLDATNDITGIMITIDGAQLAKQRTWIDPGKAHLIRLKSGAIVKGRLVNAGKPVPGVTVSMATQDRSSDVSLRGIDVATDGAGRFALAHVPARMQFVLSTKMKEMETLGVALSAKPVTTTEDGSIVDLGDLDLVKTHAIHGRVVLSDGHPIPARTRIYFSLENGADSQNVLLDQDGWFEFLGVPPEESSLSVRVPGYRVSARNPNKDWYNDGRLVGRVEKDLDDFFIHLEPGDRLDPNAGPADGGERQPRQKPFQGAKL